MQQKDMIGGGGNENIAKVKRKESKEGARKSKKKRSISVQEKSDLIEYYLNQKESEYSQSSIHQPEQEVIPQNLKPLPLINRNESSRKLIVSKTQLNAKLKKQLNLLGVGEEQVDSRENTQSNNEFGQTPFSSKYVMKQAKERFSHNMSRNHIEIRDCKSTSRILQSQQLQQQQENSNIPQNVNFESSQRNNNQLMLKGIGMAADQKTNTLFLSNSFAKRENFVLSRGSNTTNRYGQDQNLLVNSQHLSQLNGQKSTARNVNKSFVLNNELTNNTFDQVKSKQTGSRDSGGDTNKSTYLLSSKDNLQLQQLSSTYQEEGVDKIIGNAIQLKSKDDKTRVPTKEREESLNSNLLNLPIHHSSKHISNSPINNPLEKKQKQALSNSLGLQNDYIKFQNQFINVLLPQPTEEEKQDIELQKEKDGLLKYFNFPRSINLQENQMNKLEQSKLVFQAYLSYRSPKFVAEKMKDQSLLQVLHKVKSQFVGSQSHRQTKNQFYSKNNSPSNSPNQQKEYLAAEIQKEQFRDYLKDKDILQNNNSEYFSHYQSRELLPKQPNLLSELIGQLIEREQQKMLDSCQGNQSQSISESYQSHFLFNRSKSVDRGSLVKQQKRDQFNQQFNLEMMRLRTKERKLVLNDSKILPIPSIFQENNNNSISELPNDIFNLQKQNRKYDSNQSSKENINDKSSSYLQSKLISPNLKNNFSKRSKSVGKQRYLHKLNLLNESKDENEAQFSSFDHKMVSSGGLKSRVPTAYNDAHINNEVHPKNESSNFFLSDGEKKVIENNLNNLIDSYNSESLFSDKPKDNIQNMEKQNRKSLSKKKKQSKIINDINKLQIVNHKYLQKQEQQNEESLQNLNNSFDNYQPSSNHLINNKKHYQKSKKQINLVSTTTSQIPQEQQPQQLSQNLNQDKKYLKIDPLYLSESNQKYRIIRQLIMKKQHEIQQQN